MSDSTQSIVYSAKRFFTGTAFSRISGLVRDMAMAFAFGTHGTVAAFLVAFRFSHLLRRLLGEGALQAAFIPHFETLKKENPLRAGTFFRDISIGLSLLLIVIILITMGLLWASLNFLDLSPGNKEIVWLTFLMMPGLLFICLFGINASLLQCEKSFFTPSVAPVAFNLIWILGIAFLWKLDLKEAMNWLSLFIVFACMIQWLITVPKALKILKNYGFLFMWQKIAPFSLDVRGMVKPLFLGIVGVAASQINNALDAVFARYAETEGPAYLWYAVRMQQLPLALFGIALSGAILPPLTRAIKANDNTKFRHFLNFALSRSVALMLPLTFALFILGTSSVTLLYGHGDFNLQSVNRTTLCLWGYGVGLIPMTIVLILAPAFYAQNDYRTPTQASVVAMGLNLGLNSLLIAGFGFGAASVALATSASAWINAFQLILAFRNKMGPLTSSSFWKDTLKVLNISLLATFFAWSIHWLPFEMNALLLFSLETGAFFGTTLALSWITGTIKLYQTHLSSSEPSRA